MSGLSSQTLYQTVLKRLNNPSIGCFNDLCLEIFRFQAENIGVYKEYIQTLGLDYKSISKIEDIPFLPIQFFKTHKIYSSSDYQLKFESSGTTSTKNSYHYVSSEELYQTSIRDTFENSFGSINNFEFFGLLPSYLERGNSSLVYMVRYLMQKSGQKKDGFFLDNFKDLKKALIINKKNGQPTILFGVSYALVDFSLQFPNEFEDLIVIETGGMKGRRKEMIREELHSIISEGLGTNNVFSEYGMTELLSMSYSNKQGYFQEGRNQKVLIRDINDPRTLLPIGANGGINIIDLNNLYSCSFIETSDIGRITPSKGFEVLGRFDQSDIRGCSLLYS